MTLKGNVIFIVLFFDVFTFFVTTQDSESILTLINIERCEDVEYGKKPIEWEVTLNSIENKASKKADVYIYSPEDAHGNWPVTLVTDMRSDGGDWQNNVYSTQLTMHGTINKFFKRAYHDDVGPNMNPKLPPCCEIKQGNYTGKDLFVESKSVNVPGFSDGLTRNTIKLYNNFKELVFCAIAYLAVERAS